MAILKDWKCPEHGFSYISIPRDTLSRGGNDEGVALRWLAKCPLRYCYHGIAKPVENREFTIGD